MSTHYDTLGVSRTATRAEIRRAANKLARRYHSDTSTSGKTDSRYQDVIEAKAVLTNQKKREAYDRSVFGTHYTETPDPPTFSFAGLAQSDFLREAREGVRVKDRKEPFIGSINSRRQMLRITLLLGLMTVGASLLSWISAVYLHLSLVANPRSEIVSNLIGVNLIVWISVFRAYSLGRLRVGVSAAIAIVSFLLFASTSSNGVFTLSYLLLCASSFLLMLTRARPRTTEAKRKSRRIPASEKYMMFSQVFGDDQFSRSPDPISEPLCRETAQSLALLISSSDLSNTKVFNRIENDDVLADHVILSGSDIILVGSASVNAGTVDPNKMLDGACRIFTPGMTYMKKSLRNLRAEFPESKVRGIIVTVPYGDAPTSFEPSDLGDIAFCTPSDLAQTIGMRVARNQTPLDLDIAGYLLRSSISRSPSSI